jgi:hypothetical protein
MSDFYETVKKYPLDKIITLDETSASNIYKIAYQAIHKLARPTYLCRETSNHTTLPSSKKQTLHGYVKTRP